tara:strand:- start:2569 stop:4302 length:1734 start_codon:yes stop_codon:yes gene_type:complete
MTGKYIVKRFWKIYIKTRLAMVFLCLALLFVVSVSFALYPVIIGWVFEAIEEKNVNKLYQLSLLIIIISLFKSYAVYRQIHIVNKLVLSIIENIQNQMSSAMIESDIATISSQPPGHFVSRIVNDLNLVRDALVRVANSFVKDSFTLIAMVLLMFWYDWFLATLVIFVFPFAIFPIVKIGLRQRKASYNLQIHMEKLLAQLSETIANVMTIKAYSLEQYEKERSKNNFRTLFQRLMKIVMGRARVEPILEIIGGIAISSVVFFGAWRLNETNFGVGDFAGFITAMLLMIQPARGLGSFNSVVQEGIAAVKRIFELIDKEPAIVSHKLAKNLESPKESIIFENVSFKYNQDEVIKNISFKAEKGKVTAIVGSSGSGKSTILGLIPRFYDVLGGSITIGNQDIREMKIESLRSNIAYVSQQAILFNDTIKNNIIFGRPSAEIDDIKSAAKNAAANDFIELLSQGYDSNVGSEGSLLSGGQRQRIALARAFLRDAPILLLDEATSSLDSESESIIQDAMDKLSVGRTTLVVAHRLSTVRNADQIIVLDQGKIVESGSHQSLIELNGLYTNFCRLQFFSKE